MTEASTHPPDVDAAAAARDAEWDAAEWDRRYAGSQRIWSGEPNAALIAEVADLPPGRALDVGCGEGADAVWLARRGWAVTGLDPSGVALQRAFEHARQAGVAVRWMQAGLMNAALPEAGFDLVSAQYLALRPGTAQLAERALVAAVAPHGVLLVVHHAPDPSHGKDHDHGENHDYGPIDAVLPADVAELLGQDWSVEFDERRPRHVAAGAGAHHIHDVVLRAQRR